MRSASAGPYSRNEAWAWLAVRRLQELKFWVGCKQEQDDIPEFCPYFVIEFLTQTLLLLFFLLSHFTSFLFPMDMNEHLKTFFTYLMICITRTILKNFWLGFVHFRSSFLSCNANHFQSLFGCFHFFSICSKILPCDCVYCFFSLSCIPDSRLGGADLAYPSFS